jgi:hypothetical protein
LQSIWPLPGKSLRQKPPIMDCRAREGLCSEFAENPLNALRVGRTRCTRQLGGFPEVGVRAVLGSCPAVGDVPHVPVQDDLGGPSEGRDHEEKGRVECGVNIPPKYVMIDPSEGVLPESRRGPR